MTSNRVGLWTGLFDGPREFEYEIKHAKDFDAKWLTLAGPRGIAQSGHVDIDFNGLPGWLPPLWGSDGTWLYIRRPEGVWRSRIPKNLLVEAPISFVQNRIGPSGLEGRMFLSTGLTPSEGWMDRFQKPCAPEEIDGLRDQKRDRQGVEVDFYAPPLVDITFDGARVVAKVGDLFCDQPHFNVEKDWLVATDARSGQRCAFPLTGLGSEPALSALKEGCLWLSFEGPFLEKFEAKVNVPAF